MKTPLAPTPTADAVDGRPPDLAGEVRTRDGRTRDSVVGLLLERGPSTAAALAERLGLSATAVRRHLDVLVGEGAVTTREAAQAPARGRGRPARQFLLTPDGRARAARGERGAADLAVAVLRQLEETAGPEAVREFARRRVTELLAPHAAALRDRPDPSGRAAVLAGALSAEGFAASTREAGTGEQLCQHHCPVASVAAEFPQLCEAEAEVFAQILGTRVQRIATIARGDAACTTHVPGGYPTRDGNGPPDPDISSTATSSTGTGRQVV